VFIVSLLRELVTIELAGRHRRESFNFPAFDYYTTDVSLLQYLCVSFLPLGVELM
jgi:hypothetical protein